MVIIWSPKANKRLEEIYEYYKETGSKKIAKSIVSEIVSSVKMLKRFPKMAAIEPHLEGQTPLFRSLLVRNIFKVIYFVREGKDSIEIVTIWDCRQNPGRLKEEAE